MVTKFDVGDEVLIKGVVREITVDHDGTFYDVVFENYNGKYSMTFAEKSIEGKK